MLDSLMLTILGEVPCCAWLTDPQRFRRYFFDRPRKRIKQLAAVYTRAQIMTTS
jgi:hypothetical protein